MMVRHYLFPKSVYDCFNELQEDFYVFTFLLTYTDQGSFNKNYSRELLNLKKYCLNS